MSELSFNLESLFLQNSALWGQKEAMVTQKIMDAQCKVAQCKEISEERPELDTRMGTPFQLHYQGAGWP